MMMPLSPTLVRHTIGLVALGCVVAGIWGLLGWPAAAITAGAPFVAFYLWGEARDAREGGTD